MQDIVFTGFPDQVSHQPELKPLPPETTFYQQYTWCLNAFPRVEEAIAHLRDELNNLLVNDDSWQSQESAINALLLSCAVSEAVDDSLGGPAYDFSRILDVFQPVRPLVSAMNGLVRAAHAARGLFHKLLVSWREDWETTVCHLTRALASSDGESLADKSWVPTMLELLQEHLPSDLLAGRIRIPRHFDRRI